MQAEKGGGTNLINQTSNFADFTDKNKAKILFSPIRVIRG
jgi:hypothetical protein